MITWIEISKNKVAQEGIDSALAFIGLASVSGLFIGVASYFFIDRGFVELIDLGIASGAEAGIIVVLGVIIFAFINEKIKRP